MKEGTSVVLLHSGLDEKLWVDSMECCCYLQNVRDLQADGKSPCERRFGEPQKGMVPFGAMVEYHPISARDLSRLHQFVVPGIFLGYTLIEGGMWKGDIVVADIEELGNMDASKIYP